MLQLGSGEVLGSRLRRIVTEALPALLVSTGWLGAARAEELASIATREVHYDGSLGLNQPFTIAAPGTAPFSLARMFSQDGNDYLLLFSGGSGEARVLRFDANGVFVSVVQAIKLEAKGARLADLVVDDDIGQLFLLDPRFGEVRRFTIGPFAQMFAVPSSTDLSDALVNKTSFDAFFQAEPRLFALEQFSGDARVLGAYSLWYASSETYSLGWTDVDHWELNGSVFRLLYKEAGDPFHPLPLGASQAGRFAIVELDSDGMELGSVVDKIIGPGYSSLGFYRRSDTDTGIVAYSRDDDHIRLSSFASGTTVVPDVVIAEPTYPGGYDELLSYRRAGKTFFVGVRFDLSLSPSDKLGAEDAARFAQCVDDNLAGRAMGYQVSLVQGGIQYMARASGQRQIQPKALSMDRETRIPLASVSKLFTTITALKHAEDGPNGINLNASIASQLDTAEYPVDLLDAWVTNRTPLELLAQVTGNDTDSPVCTYDGASLTIDCSEFVGTPPPNTCGTPQGSDFPCRRSYSNPHFTLVRELLETAVGIESSPEFDQFVRSFWVDAVVPGGPTCLADEDTKVFGLCPAGDDCLKVNNQTWKQSDPENVVNGWSNDCATRGWVSSAEDLTTLSEAVAAGQVLSPNATGKFLSTDFEDLAGNGTAIGWDEPYKVLPYETSSLGKSGSDTSSEDTGMTTFVTNLGDNTHAALLVNSRGGVPDAQLVFTRAYAYAKAPQTNECLRAVSFFVRSELELDEASEAVPVESPFGFNVVARDEDGNLELMNFVRVGGDVELRHVVQGGAGDTIRATEFAGGYLVAYRDAEQRLRLARYKAGPLKAPELVAEASAEKVSDISLVRDHPSGVDFATVTRQINGRLKITPWTVNEDGEFVSKQAYSSSYAVNEVAATHGFAFGSLAVAARQGGVLRLRIFSVEDDGIVIGPISSATDAPVGTDVRVQWVQTPTAANYYVTALRNSSGLLEVTSWSWDAIKIQTKTIGAINGLGGDPVGSLGNHFVFPVIGADGKAHLKAFTLSASGEINLDQSPEDDDAVDLATMIQWANVAPFQLGPYATSTLITPEEHLKLINWEVLDGAPE